MPPRSLASFLAAARAALNAPAAQRTTPLTFVVGNESADLDSLSSAVLYAYLRSHAPNASLHIPLAHLLREDLVLRPELAAALAPQPVDSLLTLSDLPPSLRPDDTRWFLVDHNALTGDLGRRFGTRVAGCVDHHVDEGAVPHDAATRVIEKAGSCASLVVRETAVTWKQLARDAPDADADHALARLALAPILVDTSALQSASKTTETDREAVALATSFFGEGSALTIDSYYAELTRLKDDIATFSYSDVLRKDYKQWHETAADGTPLALGMSTVVQGFDYLLQNIGDRDALLDALGAFARDRRLDLAAIMTAYTDNGTFGRQLLVWARTPAGVRAAQHFVAANTGRLQLVPWGDGRLDTAPTETDWRACWTQGSVEYSRKQLAPSLRESMRM